MAATIVGSSKSETIRGTSGRDVIVARGGRDRILARPASATIRPVTTMAPVATEPTTDPDHGLTMRTRNASLAVLLALGVAGAGCGGDAEDNTTTAQKPAPKPAAAASNLQLAADPSGKIAFDKKTLEGKAGKNTIDFQNASQTPHAVEVEGNGIEEATETITGGKASLTVDLKPGKYEFYCPVDDHKGQGMEGTLTVK